MSLLAVAVPALAQPAMPQPGPEHEMLKKDVGTWDATVEFMGGPGAAPSVSKGYYTTEGTYDPATKTLTATMEGRGPDGTIAKTRETTEWKDPDTRVFTMYGPDGKSVMMRITYERRK